MPTYEYLVKDRSGKSSQGVREMDSQESLVSQLRTEGFFIISIHEAKPAPTVFGIASGSSGSKKAGGKSGKVQLDDLVVFSRQMATLVGAGIPLIQTLDILGTQLEKEKFRSAVKKVHDEVQNGSSLSESLMKHPKIFPSLFIQMVRAGEKSGSLEEILDRVANYLEKTSVLQKKVKSAMMYPAVVTIMAFLVTFGMLAFVIPKFATIFDGLGAKLPAPTLFLINLSGFLAQTWWIILPGIVAGFWGLGQLLKIPSLRLQWDGMLLRMPVFGPLLMKVAVSKFARTLATLVKSGVAILSALDIVCKTAGNMKIEEMVISVMESVKKGETIAGQLERRAVFPAMVTRMIAIGEETGELEEMLVKVADFYDAQVDASVDGLTSLIEPLIIAFLGVVIGGIVIALFLPILSLTQHV